MELDGAIEHMEAQHEYESWQEYLGQLIKNSQEKRRLAYETHVKPITLSRWAEGKSQPREENLRRLARVLQPDHSLVFLQLIEKHFPSLARENLTQSLILPEIPSELYAQVLQLYAKIPSALARRNLQDLILERAIEHLDPDGIGMSIVLVCCVPARPDGNIRSLRQIGGIATPPWEKDQERQTIFLGAESVAGSAVMTYRMAEIESRDSVTFSPAHWTEFENSAVAYPILRQARIAGALVASSPRPHYFTQAHKNLLELYAYLAVLIFEPGDFSDPGDVKLGVMPDFSLQEPFVASFERRVQSKSSQTMANRNYMNQTQIRQNVWQDIADELLQLPGQE